MSMLESTRVLLKEVVEFYEACGRNRNKTMWHFFKAKRGSKRKIYRLILRYDRKGPPVFHEEKKKRKRRKNFLSISEKVLQLLTEDPSVSIREGAQILGISPSCFQKHKIHLLTRKQSTSEICDTPPSNADEVGVGGMHPPPAPEVNLKLDESHPGSAVLDYGDHDDDSFNDCGFEDDFKPEPSTTSAPLKKPRKSFRHCLICYNRLHSKKEGVKKVSGGGRRSGRGIPSIPTPLSSMSIDDGGELGQNLSVIFALKYIFGMNSSDLVRFLEISKGKNPKGWYHLCSECDGMMKEAVAIQHKVLQLTKELEMCKGKIKEKVKNSCGREMRKPKTSYVEEDIMVTKLIRESVCPPRKTKRKEVGGVKVKMEPEPLQEMNEEESHWEPSSGSEDHEITENEIGEPRTHISVPSTITSEDTSANAVDIRITLTETEEGSSDTPALSSSVGHPNRTKLKDMKMKPKLVVCELCGEEMRKLTLPLHMLRVHGVVMEGFIEFKCPEKGCQYTTLYKANFNEHKKKVHASLNKSKWACQFCGKKFKCGVYLRNHENQHKNAHTRPYQCEICGQGFAVYTTLWCHIKGVHQGYVSPYRRRLMAQKKGKITSTTTLTDCKTESSS